MKKFIAYTSLLAVLIGCGKSGDKGELVGINGGNGILKTLWDGVSSRWIFG
jgi:hypothetical protein